MGRRGAPHACWVVDPVSVRIASYSAFYGDAIVLELVPIEDRLVARAFLVRYTDAAPPTVPLACPPFDHRVESGRVRLSSADVWDTEALHGELELALEGGHSVAVAF